MGRSKRWFQEPQSFRILDVLLSVPNLLLDELIPPYLDVPRHDGQAHVDLLYLWALKPAFCLIRFSPVR